MSRDDLLALLNTLLESERAGAKALTAFQKEPPAGVETGLLAEVGRDEARYCAGLTKQIRRLGGSPSAATGAFFDKIIALEEWPARFRLLDRGQRWVAKRIDEVLPQLDDAELTGFLIEMRDRHNENIDRCAKALPM
jgi:hypothetical protein